MPSECGFSWKFSGCLHTIHTWTFYISSSSTSGDKENSGGFGKSKLFNVLGVLVIYKYRLEIRTLLVQFPFPTYALWSVVRNPRSTNPGLKFNSLLEFLQVRLIKRKFLEKISKFIKKAAIYVKPRIKQTSFRKTGQMWINVIHCGSEISGA
jgi:hypothetical protein